MRVTGALRKVRSCLFLAGCICWLVLMHTLPIAAAPVTTVRPVRVCAASTYTFALFEHGRVLAWGWNSNGQLGVGDCEVRRTPVWVPGLVGVREIACYGNTVFALCADGQILAWGDNPGGIIRQSPSGNVLTPLPFAMPGSVRSIASSGDHVLAVLDDGRMAAWGRNMSGQLGLGYTGATTEAPALIPGLSNVIAATTTRDASFALCADGTVWAWGGNTNGELGLGNAGSGTQRVVPTRIPALAGVTMLKGGQQHVLAVGEGAPDAPVLYGWGADQQGQTGTQGQGGSGVVPTPAVAAISARPIALAAAGNASMAVTDDGHTYVWGANTGNVLGTGDPVGTILRTPTLHPTLTDVVDGALTMQTGFAILANGSVCAWGKNLSSQLGLGDTLARPLPDVVLTGFIYDSLHVAGEGNIQSALRIVGVAAPMTLVVEHPLTLAWSIDPNLDEPFLAPSFTVKNLARCPLQVAVAGWGQEENSATPWEDVLPDYFADWAAIPSIAAERKIAIGIQAVAAPGWQPAVPQRVCWAAASAETVCGTLQAGASGVFAWEVRHGLAMTQAQTARHTLVFIFRLQ